MQKSMLDLLLPLPRRTDLPSRRTDGDEFLRHVELRKKSMSCSKKQTDLRTSKSIGIMSMIFWPRVDHLRRLTQLNVLPGYRLNLPLPPFCRMGRRVASSWALQELLGRIWLQEATHAHMGQSVFILLGVLSCVSYQVIVCSKLNVLCQGAPGR